MVEEPPELPFNDPVLGFTRLDEFAGQVRAHSAINCKTHGRTAVCNTQSQGFEMCDVTLALSCRALGAKFKYETLTISKQAINL